MNRHAEINGIRIHFREFGDPSHPALLMLHGSRGHAYTFDHIVESFCDRYRIIVPTMRGNGDSAWAEPESYVLPVLVNDLHKLTVALDINVFSIVGRSFGGVLGSFYAQAHPDRVKSLILVDIGPDTEEQLKKALEGKVMTPMASKSFEEFMETRRAVVKDEALNKSQFENLALLKEDGTWISKFDPDFYVPHRLRPTSDEWWSVVNSFECPVLLLRGSMSKILDASVAERMIKTIPNCEFYEFEGLGHSLLNENPEGVTEQCIRFLEGEAGDA